ncbi:MAG: hypothetical protein P8Y80_15590 [Acidobacteriota bacterium]
MSLPRYDLTVRIQCHFDTGESPVDAVDITLQLAVFVPLCPDSVGGIASRRVEPYLNDSAWGTGWVSFQRDLR